MEKGISSNNKKESTRDDANKHLHKSIVCIQSMLMMPGQVVVESMLLLANFECHAL